MSASRDEAVQAARKRLRGFASAPDARKAAHDFFNELSRAQGWSVEQRDRIAALGAWLETRPTLVSLQPYCASLLAKLR